MPVERELIDGQLVPWEEGKTIRIIETPGHSPGSVSFFSRRKEPFSQGMQYPGRNDPIYVDPRHRGIVQKLKELNNVKYLLSSWHEPILGDRIAEVMDEGCAYIGKIMPSSRRSIGKSRICHPRH